jgi:hypothetical protein
MGSRQPGPEERNDQLAVQRVRRLPETALRPRLTVELLVVPDCPNEKAARELIRRALADLQLSGVSVSTTLIADNEEAARRRFIGSPTILLNDRDPFAPPGASTGLACRVYNTPTGPQGVPAFGDLRRAIKGADGDSRQVICPTSAVGGRTPDAGEDRVG